MSHNDDYRHAWTPNDDVDSDDVQQAGVGVVAMPYPLDLPGILPGLGVGAGVLGLVGACLFIQGDTVDPGDPEDEHCTYHLKRCLNTKLGKKNSGGKWDRSVCRDCFQGCKAEDAWPTRTFDGRNCNYGAAQ